MRRFKLVQQKFKSKNTPFKLFSLFSILSLLYILYVLYQSKKNINESKRLLEESKRLREESSEMLEKAKNNYAKSFSYLNNIKLSEYFDDTFSQPNNNKSRVLNIPKKPIIEYQDWRYEKRFDDLRY